MTTCTEQTPDELVAQGRRELVCGNIIKAVENFQKACEALSSLNGDLHEALGTPNLLYGSALLELSRMESSVIGNALDGIPEVDESESDDETVEHSSLTADEKDDLSNQVLDAMLEGQEQEDRESDESEASDKDEEESTASDKDKEESTASDKDKVSTACESAEEVPPDSTGADVKVTDEGETECKDENGVMEATKSDDDEEVSNLQIAWEVIEVAKKIFSQKNDDASKLSVAECLEKLGEISREKEDYDQAIADLKECLEIRTNLLGTSDRCVAECYYQLGATYAVSGDLENASISFKESVKCLKSLAENIRTKIASIEEDDNEEKQLLQTTLKEVETLIPDVESRCSEIEEDRLADNQITSEPSVEPCSNGDDKPVDDISHLVRKKRPIATGVPENSTEVDGIAANGHNHPSPKKAKLVSTNGNGVPVEDQV